MEEEEYNSQVKRQGGTRDHIYNIIRIKIEINYVMLLKIMVFEGAVFAGK